jgi:hypothetical protein
MSLTHLRNLVDPLAEQLKIAGVDPKTARGLDVGCGPTAVLAALMQQHHGFTMESFDPNYFPRDDAVGGDAAPAEERYTFVTLCEVVEHFERPREEFDWVMERLLARGDPAPDVFLALQTKSPGKEKIDTQMNLTAAAQRGEPPPAKVATDQSFLRWRYANDQTHVAFFSDATFAWLEQRYGFECLYRTQDVWIGRRTAKT